MMCNRFDPVFRDNWHRRYAHLEPAHRLALLTYGLSGLVYPFGAASDHLNMPNRTLFTPKGEWIQTYNADPLQSWE
jgi:hypothetical protein